MKMRKFWILGAMVALLGSCAEVGELDQSATLPEQTEGIPITSTITMSQQDDDSSSRVASDYGSADADVWNFAWSAADATGNVYAYCRIVDGGSTTYQFVALTATELSDGDATATFEGTLPANTDRYRIAYKSDDVTFDGVSDLGAGVATDEYLQVALATQQDGNLNSLVLLSDLIIVGDEDSVSNTPTLYHAGGFVQLNLDIDNVPEDVTLEKVVAGLFMADYILVSCFSNTEVSDLMGNLNFNSNDDITIEPSEPLSLSDDQTLYMNIFRTYLNSGSSFTFELYFSNGECVTLTKKNESDSFISFFEGKFYEIDLACDYDEMISLE